MPKRCLVCKQRSDRIFNLSYHMFPTNKTRRQEWITALNLTKTPNFKTSYICSDHFHKKSFVYTGELRRRQRLYKDAIPIRATNADQLCLSTKKELLEEPKILNNNSDKISSSHDIFKIKSYLCTENKLLNGSSSSAEEICDYNISKRKHSFTESLLNKRIEFMDGLEHICREDFNSDENWNQFLKYIASQKLKISALRRKHLKNISKIYKLKKLIADFKKQREAETVKCLKDLPPKVEELLRMKDLKPTAHFSKNLKNYDEAIRFHTPIINKNDKQKFPHYLPYPQTFNSWIYTKQYKPGISNAIINNISKIAKKESANGRHLILNISFDEDSIVQPKEWDKVTNTWKYPVDAIDNKSLVLILINISAGFKAPVSYYLINSLHFMPLDSIFPINQQNLTSRDNITENEIYKSEEDLIQASHNSYLEHNYFKTDQAWSSFKYAEEIIKRTDGIVVRIL